MTQSTHTAGNSEKPLSYASGVVLVILAGVFWSTMGLGIRNIHDANVWQILLYRSCSLSAFLFVFIALRSHFTPLQTIRRSGIAGVIGAMGLVLAFSGGVYAIQTTTVANAMFLFAAAPFFAAVLGWVVLREKVRPATWVATGVATLGVGIMVLDGISLGKAEGNIAALFSALGFAIFTIALRWGKLGNMLPAVFLAGIFTLILSASICALQGYSFQLTVNDASISVAMGVFQVGAGLAIYTIGSKVVPAAELALLSMTEVFLGPVWVWLFLGETASLYTLLGGAVLLLAIAGNAMSGLRRRPAVIL
ncbi:MAG: DMT family transporter [Thiolinea sp.]